MTIENDLRQLCRAAELAGFAVRPSELRIETLTAGDLHLPTALPAATAAVYIFAYNGKCLKVGKVNVNSGPRYRSQHYRPKSSRSNLAQSLLADAEFAQMIAAGNVGDWIKQNTTRYNILIPQHFGRAFVHFVEAFFILKYRPRFEGG